MSDQDVEYMLIHPVKQKGYDARLKGFDVIQRIDYMQDGTQRVESSLISYSAGRDSCGHGWS